MRIGCHQEPCRCKTVVVLRFPAPESRCPSMNDREHWTVANSRKLLWQQAAYYAAVGAKARDLPRCEVSIELPVKGNRRRDPHNLFPTVKHLVDGLVQAGVWRDDTPEYVRTVEPTLVVGGTEVVITLTELEAL